VLGSDGRTGYLILSGSVLFCTIVIVINLKILIVSTGIRPISFLCVTASIILYWVSYAVYAHLMAAPEIITLNETLTCATIVFTQIVLVFFLNFI